MRQGAYPFYLAPSYPAPLHPAPHNSTPSTQHPPPTPLALTPLLSPQGLNEDPPRVTWGAEQNFLPPTAYAEYWTGYVDYNRIVNGVNSSYVGGDHWPHNVSLATFDYTSITC